MTYAVGSLVKARGREWVVLPESEEDMLVLRPLGGTEDEVTGIFLPLEGVETATFDLPDPIPAPSLATGAARNTSGTGSSPTSRRTRRGTCSSSPRRLTPAMRTPSDPC